MFTISATEARANQSTILDKASQGEAVRITCRIGGDVVVISAKEWQEEKFDRDFAQITGHFGDAIKDLADNAEVPVRDLQPAGCKAYCQTPVNHVLKDPESVHIVHREKLRSVCRHESHPLKSAIAVMRL